MTGDVGLLLRRAVFGPTAAELAEAQRVGYAATLSALFDTTKPDVGARAAPVPRLGIDPFADRPEPTVAQRADWERIRRQQTDLITGWWLDRMAVADHQTVEKLVFFWHGHWATSVLKVNSPQLMLAQHRLLRGAPDFRAMARGMVIDPALVYWLDGNLNTRVAPNENLARELMELFLLGIGRYTEEDVKEAGRALTGWDIHLGREKSIFHPERHDAGSKKVLGRTADFDARSLVDFLLQQEACPRFIASRLWFRYASATRPIPAATREKVAGAFPVPLRMLRVLFDDDAFQNTQGSVVKQPVEWLIGAMRQLGLGPANLPTAVFLRIVSGLESIGQVPFAPPSVGGWPAGTAWLTSAAAQVRLGLAGELAGLVIAERLRPEDMAYALCIDSWTNRTYAVLREVRDPRLLLTLGLASPEYLVT